MAYAYKKQSAIQRYRPLIAIAGIALILIVVLLSIQKDLAPLPKDPQDRALAIAQRDSYVSDFLKTYPDAVHTVTALPPETAKERAEQYPAVYGGLPEKALYQVEYSTIDKGILLIIDVENANVLKTFQVAHQFI